MKENILYSNNKIFKDGGQVFYENDTADGMELMEHLRKRYK